jgi:hypothetical protein
MSLIIAQGVPKSGSTFLFQVIKDIEEALNGFPHPEAKKRFFPDRAVPDFVGEPSDAFVDGLAGRLPPDRAFVFKTHGKITPRLAARIASGEVKAVMSFRDPRDTALSMIDAGAVARARGRDRNCSNLHQVEDAVRPAKHGWKVARGWFDCPGVLLIPYHLTATNQTWVVDRVCEHLGAPQAAAAINAKFARDKEKRITEFHKGVADRFLDDLAPDQIQQLNTALSREIDEADALTGRCMRAYGFGDLYEQLRDARNARLQSIAG